MEKANEKGTSTEERNKTLVRFTVEEVWNKGNYSALDEIVDKEFVIHSSQPGREIVGGEGVIRYLTSIRNAFPDIRFNILDQVSEGHKVVTHWVAEGTHHGIFEGIPPTGKKFKVSAIDIDYIRDGRFSECWTNMDQLGLLQQLGVFGGQLLEENQGLIQAWDNIAEGYDKYVSETEVWLANEALKRVGLSRGEKFLDVAAGCGGLSLPAARLGAEVLAIDWSTEMIRCFEKRVLEEKLKNANGRVMDGHHLELADNVFDVVGSQFGVMLFPEQAKAMKEMVRVTKPGGKVLIIAYSFPEKIDFLNFFISAVRTVAPAFPGLPTNPPPLEFQVADPLVLRERLVDAGLTKVKVETITEKLGFASGRELWNWILNGNPVTRNVLSTLNFSHDDMETAVQKLEDMVVKLARKNNGTAILTSPVNIGYGIKPQT